MQHAGAILNMMGRQRLLSRAVGKHGFLVIGESQRQIFSDNQLKIDGSLFVEKKETLHPNHIVFKSKLMENFCSSKLNNISVEDIDKFMALSVSSEDLCTACEMIEAFLSDKDWDLLHPSTNIELLHSYTCVCHILGCPKEAMLIWQQPTVRSMVAESPSKETYQTLVIYLDLMLKHNMYKELLEIYAYFNDCQADLINQPKAALLVVLALYKEGTTESLKQSLLLLHKMKQNPKARSNHRMIISPALLAYNLGQHAKACAILQRFAKQHSSTLLSQSLEMMALAKAGKLEQAMEVLREFLPRRAKRRSMDQEKPARRKVCYVAVEVVVGAAREAGAEMFNEVMDIVEEVEKHAEVVEDSLEELLFRPIEGVGRKVSRVVDPEDLETVADEEDEDLT